MRFDQDTIDEYRRPEYHPEFISDDEAARRYEADNDAFVQDAIEAFMDTPEVPEPLRTALLTWYRTTEYYTDAVLQVRDEAERP